MKAQKEWSQVFLLVTIVAAFAASLTTYVLGINAVNTWYSIISDSLILICISISGILYSIEIKEKKAALCYVIRFLVLFANLANITAMIKLLMEDNIK